MDYYNTNNNVGFLVTLDRGWELLEYIFKVVGVYYARE